MRDTKTHSFKRYIILFGGFQDTANQTKYLADLWIYDTQNFVWYNPALPPAQLKPDARSSFTLLPHEQGAVLYGGYSRVRTTVAVGGGGGGKQSKQGKSAASSGGGGGGGQRNILKPMVHQDCFFLRITPPAADAPASAPPTVRWERRKKPTNAPMPARAGATMASHRGRGILFGGVHDVEMSEEGMDSEFFNGLFAWNVERNRFFPLTLRRPRAAQKKAGGGGGEQRMGGRRGRAQANEEELLRQLAALRAGSSLEDADEMDIDGGEKTGEEEDEKGGRAAREMPVSMEFPHPRFNAQLAVQDDVLYIYGGTFEKGDREFTFDDLYAVDLGKLDGCKEIFNRPVEDWIVSFLLLPSLGAIPFAVKGGLFGGLYRFMFTHWDKTRFPTTRVTTMMKMMTMKRRTKRRTRMSKWLMSRKCSSPPLASEARNLPTRSRSPIANLRRRRRRALRKIRTRTRRPRRSMMGFLIQGYVPPRRRTE